MLQKSRTPSTLIRKNSLCWTTSVICLAAASFGLSVAANAAPTYTVLYSFTGKPNDGAFGGDTLTLDRDGNLYGTTINGGPYDFGTTFKINTAGTETVLTHFDYANGAGPLPGLIRHKGTVYATTFSGGYNGEGAVVKIDDQDGKAKLLYSFCSLANCADGYVPTYGVTRDNVGNLYGTTSVGGAYHQGVVFKVDSAGNETVLYSFCPNGGSCSDGDDAQSGVFRDSAGNLYGVADGGPSSANCEGSGHACGVVWKLDTSGNETVLHGFAGPPSDGGNPQGLLTPDGTGNLYGVTAFGGNGTACSNGCGTVFKIDARGNETVVYNFMGGADGEGPNTQALVLDKKGDLYGTVGGGAYGYGTVFKLNASGKLKTLHAFQGQSDGGYPSGLLMHKGMLYGEAALGGDLNCSENPGGGCGVVFKITQ